jgi:hypothetical protein
MKEERKTPFLRALPLPRKYFKPGVLSLEVVEYAFRSRKMPYGYWITLAAIVIPSKDRTVFGASACAPSDELSFDRNDAANRAIGRARQVAFRVWNGDVAVSPDISPESLHPTLFGKELDGVFITPDDFNLEKIKTIAEPLFAKVEIHAATIAAEHDQKIINEFDPLFEWSFKKKEKKK